MKNFKETLLVNNYRVDVKEFAREMREAPLHVRSSVVRECLHGKADPASYDPVTIWNNTINLLERGEYSREKLSHFIEVCFTHGYYMEESDV